VLRFFERANAARREGTVHRGLFHELVGSHAIWWDAAFWLQDHERAHRGALKELSQWVVDHATAHAPRYVASWARNTSPNGQNPDFLQWPTWIESLRRAALAASDKVEGQTPVPPDAFPTNNP
jgi:hypothetical protein